MKNNIYNWFDSYTSAYRQGADAPTHELKYQHSIQVAHNSFQIAIQEGFNEADAEVAEIIGILHDCGRFEQFHQYRTFNDKESEDHAAISIKVIKENNLLDVIDSKYKNIILSAIHYHNKKDIPENKVTENELPFIKVLRDADKVDIFRVMRQQLQEPNIDKKTLLLNQSEELAFSTPILESIRRKELANLNDMKTAVDFRLIQLSWIFDVNYESTLTLFRKQGHLQWLIESLPGKDIIKDELHIIKNQYLSA